LAVVPLMPIRTCKAGPLTEGDQIPTKDVSVRSRKVRFYPHLEYGRAAGWDGMKDSFVISHLHRDAKRVLPTGTPYEFRRMSVPSTSMAWYYSPTMLLDGGPKGLTPNSWQYIPECGVYAMGRFYA